MAIDRQGTGLSILRIAIGIFFIFEALGKLRWFIDSSILRAQLDAWHQSVPAGSIVAGYLERFAIPGVPFFARLVPLGEFGCGLALVLGVWTPLFALVLFLMALNFQFASGALFRYAFWSSGYGLPVLGSTLALAIGGVRLPWSLK
ncbi:MAG: DoxX family protein [Acidobacteria bacterium]|nr:DoxX family protein [Acidobacteriota bacterium]